MLRHTKRLVINYSKFLKHALFCHVLLPQFVIYFCQSLSGRGIRVCAMKTSVKLLQKKFTLVVYEVMIEISTALHLHMQLADTEVKIKF